MSLNRVASVESLVVAPQEARYRRASAASHASGSVRPHKLSFNPVPQPEWEEVAEAETVAAFEVPRWKRLCASYYTPPVVDGSSPLLACKAGPLEGERGLTSAQL